MADAGPAQVVMCSARIGRTCDGMVTVRLPASVLGPASKARGMVSGQMAACGPKPPSTSASSSPRVACPKPWLALNCTTPFGSRSTLNYDLCRRRPSHTDFPDVYTKVAIIGRVYEAGISRAWRGDGDAESGVAHGLIDSADVIKTGWTPLPTDHLTDRPLRRSWSFTVTLPGRSSHGQAASGWPLSSRSTFTSTALRYPSTTATPKRRPAGLLTGIWSPQCATR